ncbi:1-acyl-sn-glycerol-3-phosphate acyltransferase [Paraflavisolibacter sp. H34]|uniref:1-acyl-sn-glycerol-3-phosphate acyltransferase n=1 Tax=Huijunlia imazamoxiresistens TaxID=3127457 RepID=UPI003019F4E2
MFYSLLKIYGRLALKIYCPRLVVSNPQLLQTGGPLLLAANHPNSFLDGMILTTLFDQPVYSLARGDAFAYRPVKKVLHWLRLLPVYRTTEGIGNLGHNYTTFETCRLAFQRKAVVLIFSEAGSANEWHLRPLRKGTGRLAVSSWQQGIPLKVLPVALNYHSFKSFGKAVHLYFGEFIEAHQVMDEPTHGKQLLAFNACLLPQLQQAVYEIPPGDRQALVNRFPPLPAAEAALLLLPALAGALLHLPLYVGCKLFSLLFFRRSDHYDSVLTALLVLVYPFYLLLAAALLFSVYPPLALACLLLPLLAWAFTRLKSGWVY